jgi:hypothetical protein
MAANDGRRIDLAARMRALLANLENGSDEPVNDTEDSDLEAATVESIFDILDKELGKE